MRFTFVGLFPELVHAYFGESIAAKALERGLLEYRAVNIRDFAQDRHKTCDDAPYGGGNGMLMLPEPAGRALESVGVPMRKAEGGVVKKGRQSGERLVVYLSPAGERFTQETAHDFSREAELVLLCGRYEGVDQRIIDLYVDREISIGDYVMSSGEVAALTVTDAVFRLLPGIITEGSLKEESFVDGLLEYPQWTRPALYGGLRVPEILLSGHHENIRKWRCEKRIEKTLEMRADLLKGGVNGEYNERTKDD